MRFQPHLVIISAGFDAHKQDPLGNCQLTEVDFAWATALVTEVRDELNAYVSKRNDVPDLLMVPTISYRL